MSEAPKLKAACVQLNTGMDPREGVARTSEWVRRAAAEGAELVATPENSSFLVDGKRDLLARAEPEENNSQLAAFRALAVELNIHLLIGSIAVRVSQDRCANRSFLIAPDGEVIASYDKMHMFDVNLGGAQNYRESNQHRPGTKPVLAETPWGLMGLTICYDLRFPYLYRHLAQRGADMLSVPSAFTKGTGKAHWHVLLRARAIETGAFVLAPAQTGTHECGRKTYGHSLIVGPWGEVLADGGTAPGIILADLDFASVAEARRRLPALQHDRELAEQ
ncbi:MAG: carbon-nitrogen hydrolase family protein [Alphaproteobacteria bacterium]